MLRSRGPCLGPRDVGPLRLFWGMRAKRSPGERASWPDFPLPIRGCYFPLLYWVIVSDQSSRKKFTPDTLTAPATVML